MSSAGKDHPVQLDLPPCLRWLGYILRYDEATCPANPAAGAYQVPDFDINYGLGDRIQLKYETPIAIEELQPQPATRTDAAVPGQVIGGLGESLLGIKWRFYEHHPGDPRLHGRFGTGLLSIFGPYPHPAPESAQSSGDAPGVLNAPEQVVNFSIGTYPQLFLNNPTRAVPRGLVAPGPQLYLPSKSTGARSTPIRRRVSSEASRKCAGL